LRHDGGDSEVTGIPSALANRNVSVFSLDGIEGSTAFIEKTADAVRHFRPE